MRAWLRIALAVVLAVLAAAALALAHDVSSYRQALADGDAQVAANAGASPAWLPSTLVPGDPARDLLDVDAAVRLRRAVRAFVVADHTGQGFDSGQTKARRSATAQALLESVVLGGSRREAAQADDLLGILAFGTGTSPNGVAQPGQRSVDAFTAAATLDPDDEDAKVNLEIALRALAPHGTRTGSNPSAGQTGQGHEGAGAGVPGRGY